jgi:hydroxymethylpyrimidine/phosphomethylpyrimidine kinase
MVIAQIDSVVSDIGVDAVKIGMIGSVETAVAVARRLEAMPGVPIVFDPVMVATSGSVLADDATIAAFARLIRIATVVTPNLPELAALGGESVLRGQSAALLIKGGHAKGDTLVAHRYGP